MEMAHLIAARRCADSSYVAKTRFQFKFHDKGQVITQNGELPFVHRMEKGYWFYLWGKTYRYQTPAQFFSSSVSTLEMELTLRSHDVNN